MEVTKMMDAFPEIQQEVEAIEEGMIAFFEQAAGDGPSAEALQKALAQIEGNDVAPVIPLQPDPEAVKLEQRTDVSDSLQEIADSELEEKPTSNNLFRFLAIAASLAFLTSLVFNLHFYRQWQQTGKDLAVLQSQNQVLAAEFETLKTLNKGSQINIDFLSDPSTQRVQMLGQAIAENATATVFWNQDDQTILLNSLGLPEPPAGQQYQLWALEGDKPVDAGVFDLSEDVQTMKSLNVSATAFAVSLEPEGGSPSPTLDKIYVVGEV